MAMSWARGAPTESPRDASSGVAPRAGLRPLILIRGFGGPGVLDEQRSAYQGYNDGTVYPGKRGENYIYEGFLLRALKSEHYRYRDATNVVGYYATPIGPPPEKDRYGWDVEACSGTIAIDPATERRVLAAGVAGTIWVYRYYDLMPRELKTYGQGLLRLIWLIKTAAERRGEPFTGVDIVAHSMGGLVIRTALREVDDTEQAAGLIHRIVTLGTPHRGIAFQRIPRWLVDLLPILNRASDEFAIFDPTETTFLDVEKCFPVDRVLTVVGTNYRAYSISLAALMNRLSTMADTGTLMVNCSDGLVKHSSAQLPGAPRTFVHKCHNGPDSLVASREAYEIAMRFFHSSHRVRLWLDEAQVSRGGDWFGRSEYYFGVAIKPRYVDFELFHQSAQAENCYGPFATQDFTDDLPDLAEELRKPLAEHGDETTGWAGPDRLIWEGWVDGRAKPTEGAEGLAFRLNIYVGERDTFGIGFSDNVIFYKQYFVQAFPGESIGLFVHTGERYLSTREPKTYDELDRLATDGAGAPVQRPIFLGPVDGGGGQWRFRVGGTGFEAILRLAVTPDTHEP